MSRKRKICLALAVVCWTLLLVPFFLGAPAAHPATDDFTFASYTHETWLETHSLSHVVKDAVSYALRTWRDWQGTVTGVIVMALNPAVFSLEGYGVHSVLLLLLDIAAVFVFLSHFLRLAGVQQSLRLFLILSLSAVQLIFMPDMVEGIYWFNGAWFYTGANAAALLSLTAADAAAEGHPRGWMSGACTALLDLVLFALGMDNFITAMMTLSALFLLAVWRAWRGERAAAARMMFFFLCLAGGLFLSVIAPGNAVRMETDGAHVSGANWLFKTALLTMRDAVKYVVRFSLKTPLLALLLAMTPLLTRMPAEKRPVSLGKGGANRRARRVPPAFAVLTGFYLMLCAMIMPHMYSSGYAGSGRVVNMYHDYVLLFMPLAWILILRGLPCKLCSMLSGKRGRLLCFAAAAAAAVFCLLGGQLGNYRKLIMDQLDGTQDAYIAQFRNEYALCEAAREGDDVLLPAWTVQTVTGKPTAYADPAVWTNVSMADYFGVHSVRAVK